MLFQENYFRLISGITSLAAEVSQDEYENMEFMPPLKILKTLEQILKSKAGTSGTCVAKVTTETQTTQISGQTISTQPPAQDSPPKSKKHGKAVNTQEGSCQTNLNLVSFSPPIPEIIHSTEVQTEVIVSGESITVQTDNVCGTAGSSPDNSPVKIIPLVLNVDKPAASATKGKVTNQNISDIADKGLENRDLMENLPNVPEDFGDTDDSDDSGVSTPVTSPLLDAESREILSTGSETVEVEPVDAQINVLENEFSKGSDADLSVSSVEDMNASPVKPKEATKNTDDTLAKIVNETINTVEEQFIFPSKTKVSKTRKRKVLPRHKNNLKKNRTTASNIDPDIQVVSASQVVPPFPLEGVPPVPPVPLSSSPSKFRTQLKSVISKGGDNATTEDAGPVIDDNPILTRLALITRELAVEACEATLEESEVEEEIHKSDGQLSSSTNKVFPLSSIFDNNNHIEVEQMNLDQIRGEKENITKEPFSEESQQNPGRGSYEEYIRTLKEATNNHLCSNNSPKTPLKVKDKRNLLVFRALDNNINEENGNKLAVNARGEDYPLTSTPIKQRNAERRKKRGMRCGKCAQCNMSDCGKCTECKNKVKFGGDGRMKQACSLKICNNRKIVGENLNEQRKKVRKNKPSNSSNKISVQFNLDEVMIIDLKPANVSDLINQKVQMR